MLEQGSFVQGRVREELQTALAGLIFSRTDSAPRDAPHFQTTCMPHWQRSSMFARQALAREAAILL